MMFGNRGSAQRQSMQYLWLLTMRTLVGTQNKICHNSHKRQNKIDAQTTEMAMVKAELKKALQENKKQKDLFNSDKMVEAMTKAFSAMNMKEHPKTSQGTQYRGASNYVGGQ